MRRLNSATATTTLGAVLVAMLSGCITPPQNQRNGWYGGNRPIFGITNTDLGIYAAQVKKGDPFYAIYLLGWEKNAAINPEISPEPFRDSDEMLDNCRPGGLGDIRDGKGGSLVDRGKFDALMKDGQKIAEDRYYWQFYKNRFDLWAKSIAAGTQRSEPVKRRPTPEEAAQIKRGQMPPSYAQAKTVQTPVQVTFAAQLAEAKRANDFNVEYIENINKDLMRRERQYIARLTDLYNDATEGMRRAFSPPSFEVLNVFDALRHNNFILCSRRSVTLSRDEVKSFNDIDARALEVILSFLKANAQMVEMEINQQKLVVDKQRVYRSFYKTVSIQQLAKKHTGLEAPDGIVKRAPGQSELLTLD